MTAPITIRRAISTDLSAVYDGELDYIRQIEPQQETNWRNGMRFHLRQWTHNLDRMFIAECNGIQIGYCFWEIHGDDAVLASVYVHPDERGKGLGHQLLNAYMSDAASRGFRHLTLGVKPDNPARYLYESAGFLHTHDDKHGYCHYRYRLTD